MSENLFYFLLGLAFSTIYYLFPRYRTRYQLKLTLLNDEFQIIGKSEVPRSKDTEKVKERIYSLKFKIENSGNSDITLVMVQKWPTLKFPSYSRIYEMEIVDKSSDSGLNSQQNGNHIEFAWELLKPKEFITINAKFETLDEVATKFSTVTYSDFLQDIRFDTRIANLTLINGLSAQKIEPIEPISQKQKKDFWYHLFISLVFFAQTNLGYKIVNLIIEGKFEKYGMNESNDFDWFNLISWVFVIFYLLIAIFSLIATEEDSK